MRFRSFHIRRTVYRIATAIPGDYPDRLLGERFFRGWASPYNVGQPLLADGRESVREKIRQYFGKSIIIEELGNVQRGVKYDG